MTQPLSNPTMATLLAAGLIFLLALVLGIWKYRQMATSEDHLAHPYVDIAHRSALLYSFATLLVAVFVELSAWPAWVNTAAAATIIVFFVGEDFDHRFRQLGRLQSSKRVAAGVSLLVQPVPEYLERPDIGVDRVR